MIFLPRPRYNKLLGKVVSHHVSTEGSLAAISKVAASPLEMINYLTHLTIYPGSQIRWFWLLRATLRAMLIELVVVMVMVVAAATLPMFMGNRTVTVMSGSMEPAIWIGSAVV